MKTLTIIVLNCSNICLGQVKSDSAELKKQVNKLFNKKESKTVTMIYPLLETKSLGAGLVLNF